MTLIEYAPQHSFFLFFVSRLEYFAVVYQIIIFFAKHRLVKFNRTSLSPKLFVIIINIIRAWPNIFRGSSQGIFIWAEWLVKPSLGIKTCSLWWVHVWLYNLLFELFGIFALLLFYVYAKLCRYHLPRLILHINKIIIQKPPSINCYVDIIWPWSCLFWAAEL